MLRTIAAVLLTAIVSVIATSIYWNWFYAGVPNRTPVVAAQPRNASAVQVAGQVQVTPSGLALPVVGIRPDQLTDTFDAARSQGRRHDAIDIMAAEGTPVIAASDGMIEKLFNSVRGGTTIYERSPDQKWMYYYAHLSAYAPGLHEGQQVKRGEVIALVGHTGDASAAGPHLHFAVNTMAPGERWWNGTAINPYPLLAGKNASG